MQDHSRLIVWQRAHQVACRIELRLAGERRLPAGLRSQRVRAAFSIPTNIVEGCGQSSPREFARYLQMAIASAKELEYHLTRLRDTRVLADGEFASIVGQVVEVRKMLWGMARRVRERE